MQSFLESADRDAGRRERGYTLVEALVVLVIMSVLVAMGVPRFQQSLEQARADVAGANLRSIWSAQRLYWLENRTYATDLRTLQSANLIDPSLTTATAPYTYQVTVSTDGSTFTATATRSGRPSGRAASPSPRMAASRAPSSNRARVPRSRPNYQ